MSKQIVTLLYLNGIRDFSKVENYLGVKDGYYEIIYDGELRKLKMPGVEYIEIPTKEYIDEKIEELDKNIENLEKNEFIFPNSLDSAIDSVKNQHTTIKTTTIKITEEFDTFEVELQKNEQENENFLKKNKEKTVKKKEPKLSEKKIKIIESKEIDDDIDDFINIM